VKLADEHIASLTSRLSRVVVVVQASNGGRPSVQLDQVEYQEASWATGILVDPGEHVLLVTAPGKEPFRKSFTVGREGARAIVEVPELKSRATSGSAQAPTSAQRPYAGLRTSSFVAGGVGLVALGVGAAFGILTISTNRAAKDKCFQSTNASAAAGDFDPGTQRCYEGSSAWREANAMKDEARAFANTANVLVPVGIVGLAACALLLVISGTKSDEPTNPPRGRLAPSLEGASLGGTF